MQGRIHPVARAAALGLLLSIAVVISFDFPTWQVTDMKYSAFRLGLALNTSFDVHIGIEVVNRVWLPAYLVHADVDIFMCERKNSCADRLWIGSAATDDVALWYGRNRMSVVFQFNNMTLSNAKAIWTSIDNGAVTVQAEGLVDCLALGKVLPVSVQLGCQQTVRVLEGPTRLKSPAQIVDSVCDYAVWHVVLSHGFSAVEHAATTRTTATAPRPLTTSVGLGRQL